MFNIYNIEIQKVHSIEDLPSTQFSVIEHKINGAALEILIQYRSQGNPEVQAFWNEKNDNLYLVGGKIDSSTETEHVGRFTLAKTNQAWISIDLFQLGKKGELNIFKMMPATFMRGENPQHRPVKLSNAHDAVLMKVII